MLIQILSVLHCFSRGARSWLPNERGYATADTGSDLASVPANDSASVSALLRHGAKPRTPNMLPSGSIFASKSRSVCCEQINQREGLARVWVGVCWGACTVLLLVLVRNGCYETGRTFHQHCEAII